MDFPEDLFYTKEHEWVKVLEDESAILIGITEYAQDKLGDVVFVDFLFEEDEVVNENDTFCNIESVKAVSEVYSPVAGKIVETNSVLLETPDAVNEEPYEDGWFVKISVKDTSFTDSLMSSEDYEEYLQDEAMI